MQTFKDCGAGRATLSSARRTAHWITDTVVANAARRGEDTDALPTLATPRARRAFAVFILFLSLPLLTPGAPLGSAFVYQGRLNDAGASAHGNYDLRLVLFDVEEFGFPIGSIRTNAAVAVSNGLFATSIDFGPGAFDGNARWLEIGVRTNGSAGAFVILLPRQPLAPAPHSVFASRSGETASLSAGTYSSAVVFDNSGNSFSGAFIGNGSGLTTLNAARLSTGTVPDARLSANVARLSSNQTFTGANTFNPATGAPFAVGNATKVSNLNADLLDGLDSAAFSLSSHHHDTAYWKLGGNAGLGAGQFLGTTDNQPLELRVNGVAAIRLESTVSSPNVIEGAGSTAAGAVGAIISGGSGHRIFTGTTNASIGGGESNAITGSFGTVAGGRFNLISNGWDSTIGGGMSNRIDRDVRHGTIGGGLNNLIHTNSLFATLGGGRSNAVAAIAATIAGGDFNAIGFTASNSTIAGGVSNSIGSNAASAVISGGRYNRVNVYADHSTIAGGAQNFISGHHWNSIGGGLRNSITNAEGGTIAGGIGNAFQWPGGFGASIRGCAIGGGENNIIEGVRYATIPGGENNFANRSYTFAAGRRARAMSLGAFVWADSEDADFVSTDDDEFAIRAAGGVRIQSDRGIRLNPADRPLITRGWDPFTSGNYDGQGRWGLFMEPSAITIGMPAIAAKKIRFAKYNADSTHTEIAVIDQAGNLFLDGTVNPPSDRNVKTNFAAVNARGVLERVLKLPIQTWSYTNNADVRHIGPVAQDFHQAFNVGADEKHISTIDADGVALAAVQGLNQKLEERLRDKEVELQALKERLSALERTILNRARQNSEEDK